jgi:hypothetical protein
VSAISLPEHKTEIEKKTSQESQKKKHKSNYIYLYLYIPKFPEATLFIKETFVRYRKPTLSDEVKIPPP